MRASFAAPAPRRRGQKLSTSGRRCGVGEIVPGFEMYVRARLVEGDACGIAALGHYFQLLREKASQQGDTLVATGERETQSLVN